MKMKKLLKTIVLTLVISLGLILESCTTDPGLASISLEMKATTSLSTINAGGRVMNTGLEFTDVIIGVAELEFETLEENDAEDSGDGIEDNDGDGEDDNEEIEFEGEFTVDLITGVSTPDFGETTIAPGLYEEMEMELEPFLEGGLSMFVAFNYTPDGATEAVRYEYSNDQELEFEIENEAGFFLDESTLNQMLILIDLDAMFTGIDLNSATADVDGIVRINGTSNTDLATLIAQNLDSIMEGGEDDDDDGEFDD